MSVYITYVDESGISDLNAGTSHYVFLGLAIPVESWQDKDRAVSMIRIHSTSRTWRFTLGG